MGDWSWPRHARRRQPGGGSRRPPPPRPLFPSDPADHGQNQCPVPVPLWEREFCFIVGNISWEAFCENKEYTGIFHNIKEWDDSGAFENFQSAKARFHAAYYGEPSDIIPLPDPDAYIDEVDHRCEVDPALVAELDEVRLPFEPPENNSSARADSKVPRSDFVNLAAFVGTPADQDKEWDWGADQMPEPTGWVAAPPVVDGGGGLGWGPAPEKPSWSSHQYHYRPPSNRNNSGYGGGGGFDNRCSRNKNSHGGLSDSRGNRNNSFYGGGSSNRYQQQEGPSPASSGRRQSDGGMQFQQRQQRSGPRNQQAVVDEAHQLRSSGWQDRRGGRKVEWRHVVRPQRELPE